MALSLVLFSLICLLKEDASQRLTTKWNIGQLVGASLVSSGEGNYNYFFVKNISAINISQVFIPIPGVTQGFTEWLPGPVSLPGTTPSSSTYEIVTRVPDPVPTVADLNPTAPTVVTAIPTGSTIPPPSANTTQATDSVQYSSTTEPAVSQKPSEPQSAFGPVAPSPLLPSSPIGYEIPCGIRGTRNASRERIVGGSEAKRGEFPWLVSVQVYRGSTATRHICGGTIISRHWVLTVAHCVHKLSPRSLTIVAGDYDLYETEGQEQRTDVVRIVEETGFVRRTFANDIALLQVDPPLRFDPATVAPICLPEQDRQFNGRGILAGWGRLSEEGMLPDRLQRVSIPIIDKGHCDQLYKEAGYGKFIHRCQICAGADEGGLDSCQGDSGGGLGCLSSDGSYYVCGLVSWGLGCGRPSTPGLYTQVSCFTDWIHNVIYNTSYRHRLIERV